MTEEQKILANVGRMPAEVILWSYGFAVGAAKVGEVQDGRILFNTHYEKGKAEGTLYEGEIRDQVEEETKDYDD